MISYNCADNWTSPVRLPSAAAGGNSSRGCDVELVRVVLGDSGVSSDLVPI